MDTALTLQHFASAVTGSGLLGPDQLDAILRETDGGDSPPDPETLAADLVGRGILTDWQSAKLLSGVQKGFFLGKHKLLRLIASGSMSSVYEAEHQLLRRRVALKVLPRARVGESSHLERFYREAQAVARLNHPNIVRGFDVGQEGDHHYFAMEYVEGQSLQELVEACGPLPADEAAEMIRQAALGLEHAHQAGLIHRDIKPANLLRDAGGTVKLLDLGLVRSLHHENDRQAALTRLHDENVMGTVDYLSPEQAIDSHNVDIRADIYSLGCTLFFLLIGAPPFPDGTMAERLIAHQLRPPPRVSDLRPKIPEGLCRIVATMTAKRPEARYPTPAAVSEVLADWLGSRRVPLPGDPTEADPSRPTSGPSARETMLPTPTLRRAGTGGGTATALAEDVEEDAPTSTGPVSPGSPPPAVPFDRPDSDNGTGTPPLAVCWRRWAGIVETIASRRRLRPQFGEGPYRLIFEDLLCACRDSPASGAGPTPEVRRRMEAIVAPWVSLKALKTIILGDMHANFLKQFREINRAMRTNSFPTPSRRLVLRAVATLVAATLVWAAIPPVFSDRDGSLALSTRIRQARLEIGRLVDSFR